MPLIGYARVSTLDQTLDPQRDELRAAGCAIIHEEQASGADRARPVLARVLAQIRPGDTLVVVRLDRLARFPGGLRARRERGRALVLAGADGWRAGDAAPAGAVSDPAL